MKRNPAPQNLRKNWFIQPLVLRFPFTQDFTRLFNPFPCFLLSPLLGLLFSSSLFFSYSISSSNCKSSTNH